MAKLSYKKFSGLLSQNGYIISLIYYINTDVRNVVFFELKLPKSQKTIIVFVPSSKYMMVLPNEVHYKTIEIISTEDKRVKSGAFILTERSLHYLIGVRGPLVESDVAVISSNGVCYTKFNGENYCYFFASKVKKLSDNDEEKLTIEGSENSENDEIALLEKTVKKVAKKEGVKFEKCVRPLEGKVIKSENVVAENDVPVINNKKVSKKEKPVTVTPEKETHNKETSEKENSMPIVSANEAENSGNFSTENFEPIELEFVDDSSEEQLVDEDDSEEEEYSLESSSETDSSETVEKELSVHSKSHPIPTGNEKNERYHAKLSHRTNYVIPEELDVYYGAVYVGTDISIFYKNIIHYEPEALATYEQLEDNEADMRLSRLNDTKKRLALLSNHVESRMKDIEIEERGLKYQLLRLTSILNNVDILRNKTHKSKNSDSNLSELNRICEKTRKTVHDINLQLLKKREEYEDILANCEYAITELLEL